MALSGGDCMSRIRPLSQRIPASKPATLTKQDYCGGSIIRLRFFVILHEARTTAKLTKTLTA